MISFFQFEILLVVAICFAFLSALFKAVEQKILFHYNNSIFKRYNALFWNPEISWRNKWKDGVKSKGERFLFSSTILVWTTDAFHLFQLLRQVFFAASFLILGICFQQLYYSLEYYAFIMYIATYWIHGYFFELFFSDVFEEKI